MAKLSGGVAVIKVAAATESELKDAKHRVEDSFVRYPPRRLKKASCPGGVGLLNARLHWIKSKLPVTKRSGWISLPQGC